ncbi:glycosyltransferase family 2 protein [Flavobacterium pectinovorum]|uniref:Glycosyl transferase n=1 Tax=Flavobacterium pectinovorum TaxID=29533 RepID=A0AB36P5C8_9FLAO|nr:glycosyltransferase family 2 protein [Flavobacterium pectinovorum]OXB07615.1 glycosyl transferase [Flavobacterium pectinovorum]SHM74072.1 Glycosyltransferase involved in cell wall bisynthesis [Flavobacterium pectinovorum]
MALISIITINYNNLEGLKKTMNSVINQTWQEFEYIVIDGGSTDGSAAFIESKNDKIDYWVSEKDSGIYNAMNKGITKANGEYLLFLNSGDHFFSDMVLSENLSKISDYDLIYFNVLLIDKKSAKTISYPEKLTFSFFYERTLCHQATLIRKELFSIMGLYDENLIFVSDWKFFILSICKFNHSYVRIDSVLSTFYLDGLSSVPENKKQIKLERIKILKEEFSAFMSDIYELEKYQNLIYSLRKSKKLNFLIKLGLINKF